MLTIDPNLQQSDPTIHQEDCSGGCDVGEGRPPLRVVLRAHVGQLSGWRGLWQRPERRGSTGGRYGTLVRIRRGRDGDAHTEPDGGGES